MPSIAISRSGPTCNKGNRKALSNGGERAVTHFTAAVPWRRPTGPIVPLSGEPAVRQATPWTVLALQVISPTPSFFLENVFGSCITGALRDTTDLLALEIRRFSDGTFTAKLPASASIKFGSQRAISRVVGSVTSWFDPSFVHGAA